MAIHRKRFAAWAFRVGLALSLVWGVTAILRADEDEEQKTMIKRVKPSVVLVSINGGTSLGSGCVVDATQG